MTYTDLVTNIYRNGYPTKNKRTDEGVRELFAPILDIDISEGIPLPGLRKFYPHIAMAELCWTLSGQKNIEILHDNNVHIWDEFTDNNLITNAYGWRLRHHFGRDQIMDALHELKFDPSSRQVVCTIWDPSSDGMTQGNYQKNIPCPCSFQLVMVGHRLNMILHIRSSDVILGLPYDYLMYAFLLNAYANSLGVRPGRLAITLGNAHIYSKYNEQVKIMIDANETAGKIPLHDFALESLCIYDKYFVDTIKLLGKDVQQPTTKIKFEVIK